jgi:hypothetical protein
MPGDAPGNCSTTGSKTLEENVYNMAGGMPRRIIRPAPPPVVKRPPAGLRQQLRFAAALNYLAGVLATRTPDAPDRQQIQDGLDKLAGEARKAGVDPDPIIGAARAPAGGKVTAASAPASSGPAEPAALESPSATAAAAEIMADPPAPPEPQKPAISAKDEALCEYLLSLDRDRAGSLPFEAPDYCEPYLRSIGRTDRPKPDPELQRLSSGGLEEETALQEVFGDLLPPEADAAPSGTGP